MARDLYLRDSGFRADLDRMDAIAQECTGRRFSPDMFGGGRFTDVLTTHPAIFSVQYALARLLVRSGCRPTHTLGMSLGECAASVTAGVLEPEAALRYVLAQGRALAESGPSGGMLAVVAPLHVFHGSPVLAERCELALTGTSHFVVAGDLAAVDEAERYLSHRAITHLRLPVRHGFHSAAIDPARDSFLATAPWGPVRRPALPFTRCSTGSLLNTGLSPAHLWWAIRRPIRFQEAAGLVTAGGSHVYVDLGPGGVATTLLLQSGVPDEHVHTLLAPGVDSLAATRRLSAQATTV